MAGTSTDETTVTAASEEAHKGRRQQAKSGKSALVRTIGSVRNRIPDSALTVLVAVASTLIAGTLAAQVGSNTSDEPAAARAAVGEPRHDVNTAGSQVPLQQTPMQQSIVAPEYPPAAPGANDSQPAQAQPRAQAERPLPQVPAGNPLEDIGMPEGIARPFAIGPTYGGIVTSDFGPRWGQFHYGLDIAAPLGAAVLAVTDGVVLESGPAQGFGLWVRVSQDDGTIGVYGHVDRSLVTAGQEVRAGEMIATVGNRGHSTGPHLHYEVRKADGTPISPRHWLAGRGVWLN